MENNGTAVAAATTLPGFDREKLEGFVAYATENPNDVILSLESKTYWESHGGSTLAKVGPWALAGQRIDKPTRDFSIQYGAWKEVEGAIGIPGASDRLEPVEGALSALCACMNWAICINAARQGVTFDKLAIAAEAKGTGE